ncbi:hypothetical protein SDC9_148182 [bioreactor metagenome]|uniref:Uncharacterized protein n=1 Tax=bioreactor metagenome TaxID=1076179 RepID=A0A645EJT8_9ZZZZ
MVKKRIDLRYRRRLIEGDAACEANLMVSVVGQQNGDGARTRVETKRLALFAERPVSHEVPYLCTKIQKLVVVRFGAFIRDVECGLEFRIPVVLGELRNLRTYGQLSLKYREMDERVLSPTEESFDGSQRIPVHLLVN